MVSIGPHILIAGADGHAVGTTSRRARIRDITNVLRWSGLVFNPKE